MKVVLRFVSGEMTQLLEHLGFNFQLKSHVQAVVDYFHPGCRACDPGHHLTEQLSLDSG